MQLVINDVCAEIYIYSMQLSMMFVQKTCLVRCSLCVKCWIVCYKHTSHLSRSVFTHTIVYSTILQYITVYHSLLQYTTVYHSILQYTTVYCSIPQYIKMPFWVYLSFYLPSLKTARARRRRTLVKTPMASLWLIQERYRRQDVEH